jgi:hypothetical protein
LRRRAAPLQQRPAVAVDVDADFVCGATDADVEVVKLAVLERRRPE